MALTTNTPHPPPFLPAILDAVCNPYPVCPARLFLPSHLILSRRAASSGSFSRVVPRGKRALLSIILRPRALTNFDTCKKNIDRSPCPNQMAKWALVEGQHLLVNLSTTFLASRRALLKIPHSSDILARRTRVKDVSARKRSLQEIFTMILLDNVALTSSPLPRAWPSSVKIRRCQRPGACPIPPCGPFNTHVCKQAQMHMDKSIPRNIDFYERNLLNNELLLSIVQLPSTTSDDFINSAFRVPRPSTVNLTHSFPHSLRPSLL